MEDISALIENAARPAEGKEYGTIAIASIKDIAARTQLPPRQIERLALDSGVVPSRYQRNMGTVGKTGQIKLLDSCIGICGLGGLGGYITEMLARFGVGRLILVDGDVFAENNLNRQSLSSEADLGRPKTEVAAEKIVAINSSIEVSLYQTFLQSGDAARVFSGADLVIDALDTVSCRLDLEAACRELGIPLVHGAIAGNCGQVMTIFPGDPGLRCIYVEGGDKGTEIIEGNPPTTPALVAALEVQEAVKILCGGELLRHGFLLLDTSCNLYQFIPLQ
jgi:molybdopterin/thiamine biosynthesis adenylyltransferase